MTAKHRKGKSNHKHEDNFFKNEVVESEARPGGNPYSLFLILVVLFLIGGFTGTWFCFQQHQTLTYLTDNLMGIQMKIVKLQSSHEELRLSNKVKVLNISWHCAVKLSEQTSLGFLVGYFMNELCLLLTLPISQRNPFWKNE